MKCRASYRKIPVPTLVHKPGSLNVTQRHLPGDEIAALRALGLPWVMIDREICSLKIRVSVVRFRPWPPFLISQLGRIRPDSIIQKSLQVPIWCPLRRGTNRISLMLNVCFSRKRTFSDSISEVSGLMSAFLQSGRFYHGKFPNFRVRFRPEADLLPSTRKPRTRRGFKSCLANQYNGLVQISSVQYRVGTLNISKDTGPISILLS